MAKRNPKAFFRYVNGKLKTRSKLSDLRSSDGAVVSDDEEKAAMYNAYFSSVYTSEDLSSIPDITSKLPSGIPGLSVIEVKESTVFALLRKLLPDKSPGPDGIHPRVLKECATEMAHPLTVLFQTSLQEGIVPKAWKEAYVSPIHKKGSKADVGNYRPISLTSVCCKLLEKIIRDALLRHMISNGFLSDQQHGFVYGRSCTTQLLKVVDKWTEILDQGGAVDTVYLDFAKAFDTVPHQRLMVKLKGYGVEGQVLEWIGQFLIGRRQRVRLAGSYSGWSDVLIGVPQGLVLGPVLFVCYINDLPDKISSFIFMYADDTKIFSRADSDADRQALQRDLDKLDEWARTWQLQFNTAKCKVMHMGGSRNRSQEYSMKGSGGQRAVLETTEEEKDLGVWTTSDLKPSRHVTQVANKANQLLGLIRRCFAHLDISLMKTLFTTIVRPHLEYANVVWHPYLKRDIELLERVQHRATRMVPGLAVLSYEDRLRKMDMPSLVYRRARGDAIEVYKYLHKKYAVDCQDMLPEHRTDGAVTRGNSMKLKKQGCHGQLRGNFFGLRTVNLWNSLTEELVRAPSVNAFKGGFDRFHRMNKYRVEWQGPDGADKQDKD